MAHDLVNPKSWQKTAPPLKKVSHEGELDAIKDLKETAESGTNSYSSYNKKMIKALKKD